MPDFASAAAVSLFVLVHVAGRRLTFLQFVPRSIWLSVAGGVSVSYVFLHLLPDLHQGQEAVRSRAGALLPVEAEIYLLTLTGLVVFYGLERLAAATKPGQGRPKERGTASGAYLVHIGSFAIYNALIGYLLVNGERDNLVAYTAAMALHFLVNDHALRDHHKDRYDRHGRWLLAAAVIGGWAAGLPWELPELAAHVMVALLAGGVILNVMKEELPPERESRFSAFFAGVAGYSLLLLLV